MTIRLTCTECKKSLKVPEAALDKKVQCPACGARFIARPDADPPAETGFSPLPNLELDEPPRKAAPPEKEPAEPVVLDEVEVVEVAEEPIRRARRPARLREDEPEEVEPVRGRSRPRKEKSGKGLLLACLAGGLFLVLVVCGGVGFAVYRLVAWDYAESDWKDLAPPGSRCHVLMPGTPVETTSVQAGMQVHKFLLTGKWRRPEFVLLYFDLPPHLPGMTFLETYADAESKVLVNAIPGGRVILRQSIAIGNIPGREFHIEAPNKEIAITRIYLVRSGAGPERIYELMTGGPKIAPDTGIAAKFFNSFTLDGTAPATPVHPTPNNSAPRPNAKGGRSPLRRPRTRRWKGRPLPINGPAG
jgi:hypothetical protein